MLEAAAALAAPVATGTDSESDSVPTLRVGDETFIVVNTTILLLRHISTLAAFGATFADLRHDMAKRIAQLVHFYNSRSCQLILGAGAMLCMLCDAMHAVLDLQHGHS